MKTTLNVLTIVVSLLSIVISGHAALYAATTGYHLRRMKTRDWDMPRPWYVRYTNWLDAHLPKWVDEHPKEDA